MLPDVRPLKLEIVQSPSKTWRLDLEQKRLRVTIDGLEAVLQSAFLALQTPRYRHLIYSWQYGSELHTLVGKEREYALSEARRMVVDALSTNTKITGTRDFRECDGVLVFTIDTIYGSAQMGTEVIGSAQL